MTRYYNNTYVILLIILIIVLVILVLMEVPRYANLPQDIKIHDSLYSAKPTYIWHNQVQSRRTLIKSNSENSEYSDNILPKIVITLTSTPDRLHYMKPTLISLLTQNIKVDEIALNIPYVSRKGIEYIIPDWLHDLKSIKIYRVNEDEGPATKILPTLRRENDDTIVIVTDDDNIYASKTIEMLLTEYYYYNKQCAISNYGIKLNKDLSFPGAYDRLFKVLTRKREVDLVQGCSGFLITKSMFPNHVFNLNTVTTSNNVIEVPKECYTVDDVWISGWLAYNKIKIMMPAFNLRYMFYPNNDSIKNTVSLIKTVNSTGERNIIALKWFTKNFDISFGNK